MRHRLARSLGHLAYAHRYLAEARGHFDGGRLAPDDGQAAADLLAQARVAAAEGRGELAFDLLLASAGRAKTGDLEIARAFVPAPTHSPLTRQISLPRVHGVGSGWRPAPMLPMQ